MGRGKYSGRSKSYAGVVALVDVPLRVKSGGRGGRVVDAFARSAPSGSLSASDSGRASPASKNTSVEGRVAERDADDELASA